MIGTYASKRKPFRAVQWNGHMSDAMQKDVDELVSIRQVSLFGDTLVVDGLRIKSGDWLASKDGDDLKVIPGDEFREHYENVREQARPSIVTEEEHASAVKLFVQHLDMLLAVGLKLSPREDTSHVFRDRDALVMSIRRLLEDHASLAADRERRRIGIEISKVIHP